MLYKCDTLRVGRFCSVEKDDFIETMEERIPNKWQSFYSEITLLNGRQVSDNQSARGVQHISQGQELAIEPVKAENDKGYVAYPSMLRSSHAKAIFLEQ